MRNYLNKETMNDIDKDIFISKFTNAFGPAVELPVAFYYSDEP